MKKWILLLLVVVIAFNMVAMIGCQKQQVEQKPVEETMTAADTSAVADTTATEAVDVEAEPAAE